MGDLKRQRIGPHDPAMSYGPPQMGNMGYGPPPPQMGNMGYGMPPGPGYGMPMQGYGMPVQAGAFPCLKLRGLPFDVTDDDIRMFLGLDVVDILQVRRDGRFSGEAFVVLGSLMQVDMALAKNKTYMGRRYIEVFRAKKLDYYKAVVAELSDGGGPVRTGGGGGGGGGGGRAMMDPGLAGRLPPESAIMGANVDANGAAIGPGMAPGMAHDGSGAGYAAAEATCVLRLRGLPFSVQKDDIVRWFDDPALLIAQPLVVDNVHLVADGGRPSGLGFVEFTTPTDAAAALAKDKQMMGSRYIEIFPSSTDELQRYLPRTF